MRELKELKTMRKRSGQLTIQILNSSVIKFTQAGFTILGSILLARALGAESFGIYSFVLATITLAATVAHGGLPTLAVREAAKNRVINRPDMVLGIVRFGSLFITISSLLIVLAFLAYDFTSVAEPRSHQRTTLLIGLLLIPAMGLNLLRSAALRGLQKITAGQIPELIKAATLLALIVAFYPLLPDKPAFAMALTLGATLLALTIGTFFLTKELKFYKETATYKYESKAWLKSLIPLAIISTIQTANHQIDIISLGLLANNKEVGIYKAAVQLSTALALCLTAVNSVLAPKISHYFHSGKHNQLQRSVTKGIRLTLLATVPIACTLVLFGDRVLGLLFGTEYEIASAALSILVIGQIVNTTLGPVGFLLNMTGHERITAIVSASALIVNVTLNILLIPIFGIEGAAASSMITLSGWNILLFFYAYKKTGIVSLPFMLSVLKKPTK